MGDDDDRTAFEKALASMSPADVFRGKYGAPQEDEAAPPADAPVDAASREEVQRLREQREMQNAFADVRPIDRGKVRAAPPRDDLTRAQADDLRAEFAAALAPAEEAAPAAPAPRLLADEAGDDVHTLNLRAMEPGPALGQLGLFVDLAYKDRRTMIRIRVGSDVGLMAAIDHWFRTAGTTYVDEFEIGQQHGDAAIFARIRSVDIP